MYIQRTITKILHQASNQFPVLLITGPRQVGKTTCLRHGAEPNRTYVTLDDPQSRALAKEDPGLFLQRFAPPVLIDEIQYAPELLPLIKIAVDSNARKGDYWLTGSQQFHLMAGVSESLAGRVGILQLLGFSASELAGDAELAKPFSTQNVEPVKSKPLGLMELYERIWQGSFPAIAIDSQMDRDLFYGSYVQTYLQRDVKALVNVGDEMAFMKFLRAAAARTGQILNVAGMARDTDISPNTAKKWLSVLQTSGLVFLIEPYFSNLTKRMVKAPKLYFLDTGLAAYLTQWSSPQTLEAGAASGAFFETWVITEIIKSYWHSGKVAPIYYYRDSDQKEIDLLIVQDGMVYPVEIKKTSAPTKKDVRHFSVLKNAKKIKMPIGPGAVLCMSQTPMPITETIQAFNVSQI
ncbi:MAG: ATP-binding protein [Phycisphaerae bacterium]|nr:ATP-binding protein [Phycisphaerae bacterium]